MEKTKNIVIIVLLLIIALLYTCNGPKPCTDPKVVYKDSIVVKKDTIWPEPKVIELKVKKPIAKDSIRTIEYTIIDNGPCNYKRLYQDSTLDSNIVIYYTDTVQGLLIGKSLSYKLKVPLIITTDSIIYKNSIEYKNYRLKVFAGLELGGNKDKFNISPFVAITTKKEAMYSYKYNITDNTHNIGFGIKIFKIK